MKPICVDCQMFFRPEENGFMFIEGMPQQGARPGRVDEHLWKPYKLWSGDKWKCPGCQKEIVVGVGREPVAEYYQATFDSAVAAYRPKLQVNDC